MADLTEQIAERIDEMDARFVDRQAGMEAEERLPVKIRSIAPAITGASEGMNVSELADHALGLALFHPVDTTAVIESFHGP